MTTTVRATLPPRSRTHQQSQRKLRKGPEITPGAHCKTRKRSGLKPSDESVKARRNRKTAMAQPPSLAVLSALLGAFQERYQNMPVTAVRILLEIGQADDARRCAEGSFDEEVLPTIGELSERLSIPQPTVSRLIKMLGKGDARLKPEGGLRLIETFADVDARGKPVKRSLLTEDGQTLLYGLAFHPTLDDN